ncbi:MAG TPA: transporter [Polyangiaceae bacterium]|nr:transporter [Polyangiaceae bacterium]
MKKIGSAVLIILGQVFAASLASADTANTLSDPRDYQGLAVAPNGTFSAYAYFRHVSAAVDSAGHGENLSQTLGVARANYLLKFGNLSIVPIDLTLPYADATVYVPQPMSPFGQTLNNTGLADLTYLPTIGYTIHEGEEIHTILAATIYVTAPTGNYNAPDLIHIGDNRWRFQGSLIAAQRYKMLTFDLVGDVTGYTNNRNFIVPLPGMGGMTTPTTEAIMQDPSIGVEAHVGADLSKTFWAAASFYFLSQGAHTFEVFTAGGVDTGVKATATPQQSVETLRFTYGIHIEKQSQLLLQYNTDILESGGYALTQYFGARFNHFFF